MEEESCGVENAAIVDSQCCEKLRHVLWATTLTTKQIKEVKLSNILFRSNRI
jgi:hypothetical protein